MDSFRACAWCLLITTMILSLIGLLLLLAGAFGSPSPASQSSKTPADQQDDLDAVLTIDVNRWRQEMSFREKHLAGFDNVPEAIWEAHRRVAAALDAAGE